MKKYNEVMEHLEVTEEMQSRILFNVNQQFSKKKSPWKKTSLPLVGIVAAAVTLMLVMTPWNQSPQLTQSGSEQSSYGNGATDEQAYPSIEALSNAVGFAIPTIETIPFEVKNTEYRTVSGRPIVRYVGEKDTLTFVKSENKEEVSADYSHQEEIDVDGLTATLLGENEMVYLATWAEGAYYYSLSTEEGMSKEEMTQIIREVSEKEK